MIPPYLYSPCVCVRRDRPVYIVEMLIASKNLKFQTIGDELPLVSFDEFYIHTNRSEINKAQTFAKWLKMD